MAKKLTVTAIFFVVVIVVVIHLLQQLQLLALCK